MADIRRLNEDKEISPCLAKEEGINFRMWGTQRKILLDVAMMCWGVGTWLGVNGLYVQLPLLVERLPEGWALPSSMTVAVQLANVGLLVYAALRRLRPNASDAPYIYGLLLIGTLALLLNGFVYDRTAFINSTERSVAFLALTFFAALVGCTSSVLFYPYLRHFRDVYLPTYLVGEGLSGFLPSILSLIQGIGGDAECVPSADNSTVIAVFPPPRFGISVFLFLLAGLSASSLVSFITLNNYRGFLSEKVAPASVDKEEEATTERASLRSARWVGVMSLMVVLNALANGVLPSIQSYSCMPYGTRAYHLAVSLGAMANPAACLAGVWLRPLRPRALAALLLAALLPFTYMLSTALMSPTPPLQDYVIGEVLVVVSWVCVVGALSYARLWVYGWARAGGARGMRLCGAVTQLGSALGSAALFFIVNYSNVFVQPPTCPHIHL